MQGLRALYLPVLRFPQRCPSGCPSGIKAPHHWVFRNVVNLSPNDATSCARITISSLIPVCVCSLVSHSLRNERKNYLVRSEVLSAFYFTSFVITTKLGKACYALKSPKKYICHSNIINFILFSLVTQLWFIVWFFGATQHTVYRPSKYKTEQSEL
jgi:hypothetical protein